MQKRPFEISKSLYPFESRWVEIADQTIHYVDEGSGPVIVMFHGNPSWSLLYAPLIQKLRDNFRCIAPDLPGFGMSSKPTYPDYDYSPQEHSKVMTGFMNESAVVDHNTYVKCDI